MPVDGRPPPLESGGVSSPDPVPPAVSRPSCLPPCVAVVAMLVAACASGCQLVQRRGPVPPELADARRLCNEGLSAADRNDLVQAEGLLERAVKRCPLDIDARRHYAEVLWKRGERTEAVGQITEALKQIGRAHV